MWLPVHFNVLVIVDIVVFCCACVCGFISVTSDSTHLWCQLVAWLSSYIIFNILAFFLNYKRKTDLLMGPSTLVWCVMMRSGDWDVGKQHDLTVTDVKLLIRCWQRLLPSSSPLSKPKVKVGIWLARCHIPPPGLLWTSVDRCGLVWTDVNLCGPVWTCVDQCGPMWTSVDQCEPVCRSDSSHHRPVGHYGHSHWWKVIISPVVHLRYVLYTWNHF